MKAECPVLIIFSILYHADGFHPFMSVMKAHDELVDKVMSLIAKDIHNMQKEDEENAAITLYCQALPVNITFPTWLIPNLPNEDSAISKAVSDLQSSGVSASCTNKWISLLCHKVPFCSSHKKKLLGSVSRQECNSAVNCLLSTSQAAFRDNIDCHMFPDQNAPVYNPCGQTNAPPSQINGPSSQKHTNHASTVVLGSFLFYVICSLLAFLSKASFCMIYYTSVVKK
ncbi:hypothetical protein TrispH2_002104 [Trichoplax sp. H2]|nr:hypothetical protein TrispH2_002104 [Trichoplax sp. H2]|eukprot:RDD45752.1 hypothetical protein TrispH2_002104 [Trichoplax sp. H2]